MALSISLFNGFIVGIERTINRPIWGLSDVRGDFKWDVLLFTGWVVYLGCFRFSIGDFFEMAEEE